MKRVNRRQMILRAVDVERLIELDRGWPRRAVLWHVCDPPRGRIHTDKERRHV
jgi:hypothetical protein